MCWCNPNIRTPSCGPNCFPPSVREPVQMLVPWGEVTPLAIAQQLLIRVQEAQKDGKQVYVCTAVIEINERGNPVTTLANSPMPYVMGLLATTELRRRMEGSL